MLQRGGALRAEVLADAIDGETVADRRVFQAVAVELGRSTSSYVHG
ncbi:MAG: hypothetical protein K6T86_03505 [Pirellulales bacterium]|nr:hypothetical protein [Pirellulales bacterium]